MLTTPHMAGTHLLYVPRSEVLTRRLQQLMDIGSWEEFGKRVVRLGIPPTGQQPIPQESRSCMNQEHSCPAG